MLTALCRITSSTRTLADLLLELRAELLLALRLLAGALGALGLGSSCVSSGQPSAPESSSTAAYDGA